MRCFPQLSTGAAAQYPIVRRRAKRSVVNNTPGGGRIAWPDAAAERREWELSLSGLTNAEWKAIEDLFEACGGRALEFLFLDPLDNLIGWSEVLSAAAWTCGPMIERTAGRPDPLGSSRATRFSNAGQAAQRVTQTLSAPAWNRYCFSARLTAPYPCRVKLILAAPDREASRTIAVGPNWSEEWLAAAPGGNGETITCGFELERGATVEVFGLQLEAQPAPSTYKATPGRGGVYPSARFQDGVLQCRADGVDSLSTTIRITSPGGSL